MSNKHVFYLSILAARLTHRGDHREIIASKCISMMDSGGIIFESAQYGIGWIDADDPDIYSPDKLWFCHEEADDTDFFGPYRLVFR